MPYLLNSDQLTYYDLDHYLDGLDAQETGDTLLMLYLYPIDGLFTKIKRQIALRAKHETDTEGNMMLDRYSMTDDEINEYMGYLRLESAKIFKAISAYSKTINAAFRFNVNFGTPLFSSVFTEQSVDGLTVIDESQIMTENAYAGKKIVIVSPGLYQNEERVIVSNDETSFVIESAFSQDISDIEYVVVTQTEKFILIYTACNALKFETNLLELIDSLFEKALIGSVIKEWYLTNRFMDDWKVESEIVKDTITDLRSSFFQDIAPGRKLNPMF